MTRLATDTKEEIPWKKKTSLHRADRAWPSKPPKNHVHLCCNPRDDENQIQQIGHGHVYDFKNIDGFSLVLI